MTCHDRINSGVYSVARITTGLPEAALQPLLHSSLATYRGAGWDGVASAAEIDDLITHARTRLDNYHGTGLTDSRRASIVSRLEHLREPGHSLTRGQIRALRELPGTAARTRTAIDDTLRSYQNLMHTGVAREVWDRAMAATAADRTLDAPRAMHEQLRVIHPQLPAHSRHVRHALYQLRQHSSSPHSPVHQRVSSSVIDTIGYDPAAARLEVTLHSGETYAYRDVPADTVHRMLTESAGRVWAREIRGNADHLYRSAAAAEQTPGAGAQCPSCGQFTGETPHTCPPSGAALPRPARQRAARAVTAAQPAPTTTAVPVGVPVTTPAPTTTAAPAGVPVAAPAAPLPTRPTPIADPTAAAEARWSAVNRVSYEDDYGAFRAAYASATARIRNGEDAALLLPAGVTGGMASPDGPRGFGVEIEFTLPGLGYGEHRAALAAIGRDLHAEGLTPSPHQQGYHSDRRVRFDHDRGWKFETDGTVAGEIISPVCRDTDETWQTLDRVCQIVRRHGGGTTGSVGGHVHVGTADFGSDPDRYRALLRSVAHDADVLTRLAAEPTRRRHRGSSWCRISSNNYTPVDLPGLTRSNSSHSLGVNLEGVNGGQSSQVELRFWDGSLHAGTIQTQVAVSLGLVENARRGGDGTRWPTDEPLGTRRASRSSASERLTGRAWREDTERVRRFIDQVVPDPAKSNVVALFAATRWQRAR